jgi:hypothetical protein
MDQRNQELVTAERLVLASSHQAIATRSASKGQDVIQTSRLAAHEKRYFHSTSQLVWIDLVQLRDVVTKRGDWIANHLAVDSTNDRQRIQKHLSRIEEIAKLFDAASMNKVYASCSVPPWIGLNKPRAHQSICWRRCGPHNSYNRYDLMTLVFLFLITSSQSSFSAQPSE